jgi:hypothetical protein
MIVLEPQDFAYLDVTFPKRVIDVIKDGFLGHGPCTVFEAVVVVLWRCRTRVVESDPARLRGQRAQARWRQSGTGTTATASGRQWRTGTSMTW